MKTEIEIVKGLKLSDPFMIASSHWTSNEIAFRHLSKIMPSAVTLKSTSEKIGGGGETSGDKRIKQRLFDSFSNSIATFCDGPKTLEFWDIVTTFQMTRKAKLILPAECKIGLSVLQNEDYASIAARLDLSAYDYVELNYKFSFRPIMRFIEGNIDEVVEDLKEFYRVFNKLPSIIKFSRETSVLFGSKKFQKLTDLITTSGSGVIIANSKKCFIPPSLIQTGNLRELNGVIVGEHLFIETYNMIKSFKEYHCNSLSPPSITASGGVSNISQIIDVIAAGADAIQLCTIMDVMGPQVLLWFKKQFIRLCRAFGGYDNFRNAIRNSTEEWYKAAELAQKYEFSQKRILNNVVKDKNKILEIFSNSIKEECLPSKIIKCDTYKPLPRNLIFVVITGNVSSFLLSRCSIIKHGLMSLQFDSTSKFIKEIRNEDFDYDFAIIPNSSLIFIDKNKSQIPQKNLPKKILPVSKSIYELVGKKGKKLGDLDTIYHFGGTSSKNALSSLLLNHRPQNLEEIKSKNKLFPLLQFWDDNSAILAKPPLSRLYGLLGREQLQNKWVVIWSTSEDLFLVASSKLQEQKTGIDILNTMEENIKFEINFLAEQVEIKSQDLINMGFLSHCMELLTSQ